MFLWPDPEGYLVTGIPSPGVTRHHALWSADFPRRENFSRRDSPTNLGQLNHNLFMRKRQSDKRYASRDVINW